MSAWMEQRACIDVPPEVFFPGQGESLETAQAICATCPVTAQCLTLALSNNEAYGVWGGLSAQARERLPRRHKVRSVARCGTLAGYAAHRRRGEETCSRCREANAAYQREKKASTAGTAA